MRRLFIGCAGLILTIGFLETDCIGQSSIPADSLKQHSVGNSQSPLTSKSRPAAEASGPLDASISGNVYTNRFFGFLLNFPAGWRVVPNPAANKAGQQRDAVEMRPGGENPAKDPLSLLLVVENVPGKLPLKWRRLGILANKMKDPNLSIEEHLKIGAQILKDKHSLAQMVGDPELVRIAGQDFWKQRMTQVENGEQSRLTMYAVKRRNFSIQFIFWEPDGTETNDFEGTIQSVRFFSPTN